MFVSERRPYGVGDNLRAPIAKPDAEMNENIVQGEFADKWCQRECSHQVTELSMPRRIIMITLT